MFDEMDAGTRQQWLDALRSGNYQKTQHALAKKTGEFCAMGVLCDVVGVTWRESDITGEHLIAFDGHHSNPSRPPSSMRTKYGIDMHDVNKIIALNDNSERTFPEIADYIEKGF